MKIAVVGAGAWGTALACHARRVGHDVAMWALEPAVVEAIARDHENTPYLAGVKLPRGLVASSDALAVVKDAELVILVPPSEHLRGTCARVAPGLRKDAVLVVASKGIELRTRTLMSDVVASALPGWPVERLGFLSGPSFAREVASGLPTDVVVASTKMVAAQLAQQALH